MNTIKIDDSIDKILSYEGGLVRGHMFEFYGPEGEGKTSLSIFMMCAAQKAGLKVGYIEAEYLNDDHAKFFGLNIEELDRMIPETAEEGIVEILRMCEEGYGLIVVDSIVGLVPEAQLEGEVGEAGKWAQLASLLARELPKINKLCRRNNTTIVFINQVRANIQKFGMGPSTSAPGGFALKHYTSARFEVRKVSWIKYANIVVGFMLRVRAPKKNRFAVPNRDGYLEVICDHDAPPLEEMNSRRKKKIEPIRFI